jgi:trehalose synthase
LTARIEAYREVAPKGTVDFLYRLAEKTQGKTFLHINSTRMGGGVAEILQQLIPMMNDLGIKAVWDVIRGTREFFAVTKAFHNALQGKEQVITEEMYETYLDCVHENAKRIELDADLVFIHDPQPAPLIEARKGGKWAWRCHIDMAQPQRSVWSFLRRFVIRYDAVIFSLPKFAQRLPNPQFLVYPSIDPLGPKNRPLHREEIANVLETLGITKDKPILLQVSRFDRFKDPIGVINAYRIVKKRVDCQLVLAGGGATDDPEGAEVLHDVKEAAGRDPDVHVLELPPDAFLEINALQRAADIVIQKSTREGFGLTVTEAMWKGKPVIGGATGGIKVQIIPNVTGYTVHSVEGAAFHIRRLLDNPYLIARMGGAGREYVRRNFLITRHLGDYLALLSFLTQS